ncbi:MAG TPA: LEA type 2 family protein [Thermoanaerobaculia bacterium]|jgi:LEA14-like dessication related protein|nr:LEA type 2 family protein [Thermoanaerobaculia bacterium]
MSRYSLRSLPLFVLVFFTGCALYQNLAHPPKVTLNEVQLSGVSLAGADLVFHFQVDNPNSRGMVLDGIGYKLRLNGKPMLEGHHDDRIEIAPGPSAVELPMTVGYSNLARILKGLVSNSISGSKTAFYDIDAEFRFAVPVLGDVKVPLTRRGEIPLDKVKLKLDLGK